MSRYVFEWTVSGSTRDERNADADEALALELRERIAAICVEPRYELLFVNFV